MYDSTPLLHILPHTHRHAAGLLHSKAVIYPSHFCITALFPSFSFLFMSLLFIQHASRTWDPDSTFPPPFSGCAFASSHNHRHGVGARVLVKLSLSCCLSNLCTHSYCHLLGVSVIPQIARQLFPCTVSFLNSCPAPCPCSASIADHLAIIDPVVVFTIFKRDHSSITGLPV